MVSIILTTVNCLVESESLLTSTNSSILLVAEFSELLILNADPGECRMYQRSKGKARRPWHARRPWTPSRDERNDLPRHIPSTADGNPAPLGPLWAKHPEAAIPVTYSSEFQHRTRTFARLGSPGGSADNEPNEPIHVSQHPTTRRHIVRTMCCLPMLRWPPCWKTQQKQQQRTLGRANMDHFQWNSSGPTTSLQGKRRRPRSRVRRRLGRSLSVLKAT